MYVTAYRANRTYCEIQAEEHFDNCVKLIMGCFKGIVSKCGTYYVIWGADKGRERWIDWGGTNMGKQEKGVKDLVKCIQIAGQYGCMIEPCA